MQLITLLHNSLYLQFVFKSTNLSMYMLKLGDPDAINCFFIANGPEKMDTVFLCANSMTVDRGNTLPTYVQKIVPISEWVHLTSHRWKVQNAMRKVIRLHSIYFLRQPQFNYRLIFAQLIDYWLCICTYAIIESEQILYLRRIIWKNYSDRLATFFGCSARTRNTQNCM